MTRFIVKNSRPLNGNISHQELEIIPLLLNDSFLVDFQEFSRNLYVFRATDHAHELRCEMVLEVRENLVTLENDDEEGTFLAPIVSCSFPAISLDKLNEKTGFDSYLQGIIMFQFQLKILEQLFMFCERKKVVSLILTIHDDMLDYIEIYSRFFVSKEYVTTSRGERIQVVIPTDTHTYEEIIEFMDELGNDFRKILWREQNTKPTFRRYLTSNFCL
jgi:hypothetical protein